MENISHDEHYWNSNDETNRARNDIDEICSKYTNHKLENGEAITVVGKDAMVLAAYEEGLIITAAEKNAITPPLSPE